MPQEKEHPNKHITRKRKESEQQNPNPNHIYELTTKRKKIGHGRYGTIYESGYNVKKVPKCPTIEWIQNNTENVTHTINIVENLHSFKTILDILEYIKDCNQKNIPVTKFYQGYVENDNLASEINKISSIENEKYNYNYISTKQDIKNFFPEYIESQHFTIYLENLKDYNTLENFIKDKNIKTKLKILQNILNILKKLHENGFYHRDLYNGGNIMIKENENQNEEYHIKFIDLGLSLNEESIENYEKNKLKYYLEIFHQNTYNNDYNSLINENFDFSNKNNMKDILAQHDLFVIYLYFFMNITNENWNLILDGTGDIYKNVLQPKNLYKINPYEFPLTYEVKDVFYTNEN